jgi:hypothetical protein
MVQRQKGSANKVGATMRVLGTVWHNHSESMERVIICRHLPVNNPLWLSTHWRIHDSEIVLNEDDKDCQENAS